MVKGRRFKRRRGKKTKLVTKRQVENMILGNPEMKQTGLVPVAIPNFVNVPFILPINGLIQGAGDAFRLGVQITLHRLEVRGYAHFDIANYGNGLCRIVLLCDHQNDGVNTVVFNQLFTDTTAADCPNWLWNNQSVHIPGLPHGKRGKRYSVMYDKTFDLFAQIAGPTATTLNASEDKAHPFHIVKNFKNGLRIQYNNGATGSNADIISNAFYLLFMGNTAVNVPLAPLCWAMYFTDS